VGFASSVTSIGRCRRVVGSRGRWRSSATSRRLVGSTRTTSAGRASSATSSSRPGRWPCWPSYYLDEGQVERAVTLLAESQRLHRDRTAIPDRYNSVINVCRFARALALQGKGAAAIRVLSSAEAGFAELDVHQGQIEGWIDRMNSGTREMARSSIDKATAAREAEEGSSLTIDQAVALALDSLSP
jgi:hypothetical protein